LGHLLHSSLGILVQHTVRLLPWHRNLAWQTPRRVAKVPERRRRRVQLGKHPWAICDSVYKVRNASPGNNTLKNINNTNCRKSGRSAAPCCARCTPRAALTKRLSHEASPRPCAQHHSACAGPRRRPSRPDSEPFQVQVGTAIGTRTAVGQRGKAAPAPRTARICWRTSCAATTAAFFCCAQACGREGASLTTCGVELRQIMAALLPPLGGSAPQSLRDRLCVPSLRAPTTKSTSQGRAAGRSIIRLVLLKSEPRRFSVFDFVGASGVASLINEHIRTRR